MRCHAQTRSGSSQQTEWFAAAVALRLRSAIVADQIKQCKKSPMHSKNPISRGTIGHRPRLALVRDETAAANLANATARAVNRREQTSSVPVASPAHHATHTQRRTPRQRPRGCRRSSACDWIVFRKLLRPPKEGGASRLLSRLSVIRRAQLPLLLHLANQFVGFVFGQYAYP